MVSVMSVPYLHVYRFFNLGLLGLWILNPLIGGEKMRCQTYPGIYENGKVRSQAITELSVQSTMVK